MVVKMVMYVAILLAIVSVACSQPRETPLPTPDLEATVQSAVSTAVQAFTPSPTPTPDIDATVEAGVAATIAAKPTATPVSTAIPRPRHSSTEEPDRPPFRIGVMESITGPGEIYGVMAVQTKQMAVDEINDAGGINGRMLELLVEDEKCNGWDSITAYNRLTQIEGVKIILGTTCSGAILGAAPLAEEEGVVMFSAMATNPAITHAGDYIFRTAISDTRVGIDTAYVLISDGRRRLATIAEGTDYAYGLQRTTVEEFEKLGGSVVAEENYQSDAMDFRDQLARLIGANPDALHVSPQSEFTGGTIIKQVRELGWEGPIYAGVVATDRSAQEIAGEAATGTKSISTLALEPDNARAQQVISNFRERYGYLVHPWYMGSAYDTVYITAECLRRTNDDQDADGFKDCLYDITWSGAIGYDYSFDENGDVVGVRNIVAEVLPVSERTRENEGFKILGPAPIP